MSKKTIKKAVRSKKEIVSEIQLVQDSERRRSIVRDQLFPYLVEINESVGYSKVFLQAFSGLVNGVFDEQRKVTTIGHILDELHKKLSTVFNVKDKEQAKEFDRYVNLITKLKDVSVQDLSYALELSRYIDGYLMKDQDKKSIKDIPINDILG